MTNTIEITDAFPGLEELEGRYEIVTPSTREYMLYRKAIGITPEELAQIVKADSIENACALIYASLLRSGKHVTEATANALLDLPLDVLNQVLQTTTEVPDAGIPSIQPPIELD